MPAIGKLLKRKIRAGMFSATMLLLCTALPSKAGIVDVSLSGNNFATHVTSLREMRYRGVILQRYDYSCGAAAIATLLSYSYDRPTPESTPFLAMIRIGDRQKIEKLGFSMLDMKLYLDSLGYHVSGFKLDLAQLQQVRVPGIVLIQINGYKHFVVIRSVDTNNVLFADPARGMQIMPHSRFEAIWDGVFLAIRDDTELAQKGFTEKAFLDVRPRAPLGAYFTAGSNGLTVGSETAYTTHMLFGSGL